jgi:NAD(P)-dependent dehydrogenase (short-subunit alcohol dehydrogenase family)
MSVSFDFRGQVALVIGASSGMGLATARAFAEAGASTVLLAIDETAVRTAADELAAKTSASTRSVASYITGVGLPVDGYTAA